MIKIVNKMLDQTIYSRDYNEYDKYIFGTSEYDYERSPGQAQMDSELDVLREMKMDRLATIKIRVELDLHDQIRF